MTHDSTHQHGQTCLCGLCSNARHLPTSVLERRLSATRSSAEFDAVLAELALRLEARSL